MYALAALLFFLKAHHLAGNYLLFFRNLGSKVAGATRALTPDPQIPSLMP